MDTPSFWFLLLLLGLLFAGGAWRFFRPNKSTLGGLLGWSGIVGVLMVVYVLRDELGEVPSRLKAEFAAALGSSEGDGMRYALDESGHARIAVLVNDTPVVMLLDTGASMVFLQKSDAERLGFFPQPTDFTRKIRTAGGIERAAPVILSRLRIGSMMLNDVAALVSARDIGDSLLGMTALGRLHVTLAGDYVVLGSK